MRSKMTRDYSFVYDGAIWRSSPNAKYHYRWSIRRDPVSHYVVVQVFRETRKGTDSRPVLGGFPPQVAPAFKTLVREESLKPKRRTPAERKGPFVELWWGC